MNDQCHYWVRIPTPLEAADYIVQQSIRDVYDSGGEFVVTRFPSVGGSTMDICLREVPLHVVDNQKSLLLDTFAYTVRAV